MRDASRDPIFSEVRGNTQTLYIFTILSFLAHLLFFSFAFFVFLKKSDHLMLPSSYVVNLVGSESSILPNLSREETNPKADKSGKILPSKEKAVTDKTVKERLLKTQGDEQLITERIAAIKAKKRIEEIAGLRNIVSLGAGDTAKKERAKGSIGEKGIPSANDYYSKIISEIRQHWVFPDMGSKDIETIIVIRILKDGSIQIKGIEKSSGNSIFDRSALRAISKASPLTPPPYEMEIGVRFYP